LLTNDPKKGGDPNCKKAKEKEPVALRNGLPSSQTRSLQKKKTQVGSRLELTGPPAIRGRKENWAKRKADGNRSWGHHAHSEAVSTV